MLGIFAYLGATLVIAAVFTLVVVLFRPIKDRDEMRSWRVLLAFFLFTTGAPYVWCEVLTRIEGKQMQAAVAEVFDTLEVTEGMSYFRVLTLWKDRARVIAVGTDKEDWGGTDRAVVAISLKRTSGTWVADSYNVVQSLKRNRDGFTFPPYW